MTHVTGGVVGRHGRAEQTARAVGEGLEVGQLVRRNVAGSARLGRRQLHGLARELLVEVARVGV